MFLTHPPAASLSSSWIKFVVPIATISSCEFSKTGHCADKVGCITLPSNKPDSSSCSAGHCGNSGGISAETHAAGVLFVSVKQQGAQLTSQSVKSAVPRDSNHAVKSKNLFKILYRRGTDL